MLVDNKFYFLSIPRCASTSFHISCLRDELDLKFGTLKQTKSPNLNLSNEELADNLLHGHEQLSQLEKKYGDHYEVISIKRDRYQRFLSLWLHIIDELFRVNMTSIGDKISNLTLCDILPENHNVLEGPNTIKKHIDQLFLKNDIQTTNIYVYNMFEIGFTPISHYHHHNNKIIWFDINELNQLEKWVSEKIGKTFKLEKVNSSKHIETNFKIDDDFIKKYNQVYDPFDSYKRNKTLI